MENRQQVDAKLLAIMEFIHRYDPEVSLASMVSGVSFSRLLLQIPPSEYDFNLRVDKAAVRWSDQLQNLQGILFKIEEYFEQVHEKCLNTSGIDLIAITKKQELGELVKYFETLMVLLMESSMKEQFIQSIMMLQQSSQEIFVDIIKESLEGNRFAQSKYKSNFFQKLISEFDEEKGTMEKEIERLCKANSDLLAKMKEYEDTINEAELDLSTKKSGMDGSFDEGKNVKYLEEYIDRLQLRIVEQGKMYEEEKLNNMERIGDLQAKISKLEEAEELCKIYKEKYEEIMDQMQKMNIWKREKAKMEKTMEERDFMVQKLHDRIEQLTEKNLNLEQSQLDFKMELQKKQLKIQKMSKQLVKVMENIGQANSSFSNKLNEGSFLDQSLKQCALKVGEDSLFAAEDEINQLRKENEKLQKKGKQQEKEICKLAKKVERLRMLEEDKNKLEQLVFQLRVTQSEELNLMFAVFYEGFEQNVLASREMRHAVLNFNEDEQGRKQKHFRKKTGSILSKGKQN